MAKKSESEKATEILKFLDEKNEVVQVSDAQKKQIDYIVNAVALVLIAGLFLLIIVGVYLFLINYDIVLPFYYRQK